MEIYKIYCDESGIDGKSNYILMGSIWIPKDKGQFFVNEYWNRLQQLGHKKMPEHLKWTKVPSKKDNFFMSMYIALIDMFFEYDFINFRVLATNKQDYDICSIDFNKGDFEVGFYKLYYQLIIHKLCPSYFYHIRLAHRDVSKKVSSLSQLERHEELRQCLNGKLSKVYNRSVNSVLTVEPRMAKDKLLIQLADILMGAVGFHYNGDHIKSGAREGKVYLCNYICHKLKWETLKCCTTKNIEKFNIFLFKP